MLERSEKKAHATLCLSYSGFQSAALYSRERSALVMRSLVIKLFVGSDFKLSQPLYRASNVTSFENQAWAWVRSSLCISIVLRHDVLVPTRGHWQDMDPR